jgi:hypothetical protein
VTGRKQLDEILSGGHLAPRAYDEIFERVFDAGQRPQERWTRRFRWMLVPSGALAAALGVWLIFFRVDGGAFTPKGGDQLLAADGIEIACKSFAGPRCRLGDTMMFMVSPSASSGYLGAYAQRADDPRGERIWYFPDARGKSPFVTPGGATTFLEEGVKVGPEHWPGTYRVFLWLASNPIDRGSGEPSATNRAREIPALEIVP